MPAGHPPGEPRLPLCPGRIAVGCVPEFPPEGPPNRAAPAQQHPSRAVGNASVAVTIVKPSVSGSVSFFIGRVWPLICSKSTSQWQKSTIDPS